MLCSVGPATNDVTYVPPERPAQWQRITLNWRGTHEFKLQLKITKEKEV